MINWRKSCGILNMLRILMRVTVDSRGSQIQINSSIKIVPGLSLVSQDVANS